MSRRTCIIFGIIGFVSSGKSNYNKKCENMEHYFEEEKSKKREEKYL